MGSSAEHRWALHAEGADTSVLSLVHSSPPSLPCDSGHITESVRSPVPPAGKTLPLLPTAQVVSCRLWKGILSWVLQNVIVRAVAVHRRSRTPPEEYQPPSRGSEQQKGCPDSLTRNTRSCWFLGCCQEFLPSNYQQDRTKQTIFSVEQKIKILRVLTSQSIQLYTVLYCFAFDPRDIPGVCLARTQSQAWAACKGRDRPQIFQSRLWKINPFCIPYHPERSQQLERTAEGIPGYPQAAVEDTGALAGAEQSSWVTQGLFQPWRKVHVHFSTSIENLPLNSVPRFRKTSCQEFHQSICFCKRALMNQCFLTKNSFCQKSRPAPLFSYLSLKTTVLHLQNKDKNFTLFLWSTLGSRGEQLTI